MWKWVMTGIALNAINQDKLFFANPALVCTMFIVWNRAKF